MKSLKKQWELDRIQLKNSIKVSKHVRETYRPPHRFGVRYPVLHHYLSWIALYHFWYTEKKFRVWW